MTNTLTEVTPKLLAMGLLALRQQVVMPRLVNRAYESLAGARGSTIDVPIPSAIAAQAVSPAATPPSTADIAPTSVPIVLDQWYEAPFYLTDKDILTAMEGTIPMQASEAIKALSNNVDNYLFGLYTGVYGLVGTAGTTPFGADTSDVTAARALLHKQLAPMDDRRIVIDPDAEGNALNLRAFQDASFSGNAAGITEGDINRKLGFNWFMSQNVPTHTRNALGAGALTINGAHGTLGVTTISVAKGAGANWSAKKGDIITIAGHTQQYVITANTTVVQGTNTNVPISPGLAVALSGGEAITSVDSHVVNLAFHRDAFAFATRPLEAIGTGLGPIIQAAVDPESGLTLRLEITREHKRTRFSYDILYGAALIRAQLAVRIAG